MKMRIQRNPNDGTGRFEVEAAGGELNEMDQVLHDLRSKYPHIEMDGESTTPPPPPQAPAPDSDEQG